MKSLRHLFLGAVIALSLGEIAHAQTWSENYASALAQAKATHRTVLLDFTGSDWCQWCMRIEKEVFTQPAFKDYAAKNLILVRVDFPNFPQAPAISAQNKQLAEKYGVESYPTLIAIDPSEKVLFTQSGYEPGGPANLIAKFSPKK